MLRKGRIWWKFTHLNSRKLLLSVYQQYVKSQTLCLMYGTSPNLPYRTDFRMKWNFKILKLQCFTGYNIQFSSVPQSCLTFCNPMDCSLPDLPVHHQLLELAQTHVHWVGDAIQLSQPSQPHPPAFNLSQHHGLFQWVSSSHKNTGDSASASVLSMNIQDWFPL